MHPLRTFPAFTTASGSVERRLIAAFGGFGEAFKMAFDAKAATDAKAAKEKEAGAKKEEAGEKGGEAPAKRAEELAKVAGEELAKARGGIQAAMKRSGEFGEFNRTLPVTLEMQKQATNILRNYNPREPFSKENTVNQLMALGFSRPTNAQLEGAQKNTLEGRVVSPPLTAGTSLSVLEGNLQPLIALFSRIFRGTDSAPRSERELFLFSIESYNAQNRHTAALALRDNRTTGKEDLMVTLKDPSTSEPKLRKEQMEKRLTEIERQFKIGLMNATREPGGTTYVIPDATEDKVRQVRNMLATIRDPEDSRPPPTPSTGGAGGPPGGPSGGPGGPAEGQKARQEAREHAQSVIDAINGKMAALDSGAETQKLRKEITVQIAQVRRCFVGGSDAEQTKLIRERTDQLLKLEEQLDKQLEASVKNLETVRKLAEVAQNEIAAARKTIAAGGNKNLIEALEQNIQLLEKALAAPISPATPESIIKATETLSKTAEELERREAEGKLRKRATEVKGNVETRKQALEKDGGLVDGFGWNGKETMEKIARAEEILKNVRLDPALIKELEAITTNLERAAKTLTGIQKERTDAREKTAKDKANADRIKTLVLARRNVGRDLMVSATCAAILSDGASAENVESLGDDMWYINLNGTGNLKVRWNRTEKIWQLAQADSKTDADLTWHSASAGDWTAPSSYFRESGRRQANRLMGRLREVHVEHPIT